MAIVSKASIQELTDKLDAVAVVQDYVRLENKGGRFWGLCPFHSEKTASFTVNPELKVYHCFGCGKGGSVINFVMEMDKLSFVETIETLAKRFGVELVYESGPVFNEEGMRRKDKQKDEQFELYRRVTGSFQHVLMHTKEGRTAYEYLLARAISHEMIEKFRLGYAPENRAWLFQFLSKEGYSEEFLDSTALFSAQYSKSAFFSARIMFPIADRQGRIIAFGGRLLSGDGPKYINSRESSLFKKGQMLFALDLALSEIRRAKEAVIAEGYLDVISLHQAGVGNAVAPLGTAFTIEQAKLLKRWAERLVLFFDFDEAGQNAAEKTILLARSAGLACSVVTQSEGGNKDAGDILKNNGAEALQLRTKNSILDIEYLIIRSKSLFNISEAEGKAKAVAFLFPYLKMLESEVLKDAWAARIADALNADKSAILYDYRHFEKQADGFSPEKGKTYSAAIGRETSNDLIKTKPLRLNDEIFLLTVLAVNMGLYPQFRTSLSIKEVEDPYAKELFIALEECYVNDEFGMDDLLSRISSGSLRSFITARSNQDGFRLNPEKLIEDGVKKIKQKRLKERRFDIVREIKIIKKEIAEAERNHNEDYLGKTRLEELLTEKMHIDKEVKE
ncbi:DNA primase [Breznakiellaceae bacterium SP9]